MYINFAGDITRYAVVNRGLLLYNCAAGVKKFFKRVSLMRILGIDPGYAIVGYGILDFSSARYSFLDSGAIFTDQKEGLIDRLEKIFDRVSDLIEFYKPEVAAVESLYFQNNQKTAINVAEARGVILLALKKKGIPIHEYTPLQVKSSVTGYGRAEKHQVIMMTKTILNLREIPKPDDAADALAVALCHANTSRVPVLKNS
jgi:crossover junction endodeoxyribonuclease RuvC